MFKKLHINCDEATKICDKGQYKEASLLEKIKLYLHFINCKICRLYTRQNTQMSKLYKIKATDCKNKTSCMSASDKEALKKQLETLNK